MREAQALAKATVVVDGALAKARVDTRPDAASPPARVPNSWLQRLSEAAVPPTDNDELRLQKTLLVVVSVATALATLLWLFIYRAMGLTLPSTIPFVYLLLTVLFLGIYVKTRNFDFYRGAQLSLFLFAPFVIQWSIGSFVNSSGIVLLALLAPVGAMVVDSPRKSIPWFVAYVVLTILSGVFDYYLADGNLSGIPMRTVAVFFVLNFTILSSLVYLLLRYFVQRQQMFQADLKRQHDLLEEARAQSDLLLNTILPSAIANRLKEGEKTIADNIPDATVMFADIVNFTGIAGQRAPKDVVAFLGEVFKRFDELADKHGVDKIKTIGDAYMVAGGLQQKKDGDAQMQDSRVYVGAVVDMALDMLQLSAEDPVMQDNGICFHIGIATGPVTGGVIGHKRFTYDLWGDTVNIASRITAEANTNAILVDQPTYRRLNRRYEFGPGCDVTVKGKGTITIYPLIGKRAAQREASAG
jgi:class 3 adenylate cyclase